MLVYFLMFSIVFKVYKYIIEDMFNKRKQREFYGKEGVFLWLDRNISRFKINGMLFIDLFFVWYRVVFGGELYRMSLGCLNKDSKNNL